MAKIKTIQEMLEEKAAGLKIRPAVEIPKEALKKKETTPEIQVEPTVQTARPEATPIIDTKLLISQLLTPGTDYGMIQGCKKPSLFKAGAEKLAAHFGYCSGIDILNRTELLDKSYVSYEIKVTLTNEAGIVIAEGVGSANSHERRYLKGDFASCINTVLKMAKKRAYVDAVLIATATSGVFTQDMEDIQNVPDKPARKIG